MKMAILEIYPNKKFDATKGIDAHLRNSIIIGKHLNADVLITENDYLVALTKKYDILMLSYTAFYAPFQMIKKMVENNPDAPRVLISNEYEQISFVSTFPPPFIYITNFDGFAIHEKHVLEHHVFNLNLLFARKPNENTSKKYDCIYYGTFRKNRSMYFKRYLQHGIHLSTSDKNFKKYKHIGCDPSWIRKLSWMNKRETLNHFKFSLYIEDEFTHSMFNNLANRWYEAGFCNVIMLFDRNCLNTIRKSEIGGFMDEMEPFIVDDHESLLNTIEMMKPEWNKWLNIQKRWRENELDLRKNMLVQFKQLIHSKIEQNENR
jgi:hypothetical protein